MRAEDELCPVADGTLRVRRTGMGPPLLLIAGGLGGVESYRPLTRRLAGRYTVLGYDRRGHFHSTDETSGPVTVRTQAVDAAAVIRHFGYDHALVFGSSAGALIALELAAIRPGLVRAVVAHEPPAVRLLGDGDHWLAFADELVALAETDLLTAFTRFVRSLAGAAGPDLKAVALPFERDWIRLFGREMREFYRYLPDVAALRACGVPVIPAGGEDSRGFYHHRPAELLADALDVPFAEVPGAHLGPQRNAGQFAGRLTTLLHDTVPTPSATEPG
ncbi:alpha/beta hydrolase [Amycolatopsis antarctica]|uniref:Alpha/beta hydrolase n=1 Tax=Amycolatopsis antarctica TaxID=1854586 RepID=A0A263D7T4_9PSEU|nr:alpha/beta hydrolase [Amycolatopsis antarctica]OZM74572.1 alpha/beta hydrolase [Amycolatopsis antarctica]